ncbi:hypothetical protein Hanom_Chr14g01314571 [Helianthus anomalus]
MGSEDNEHGTSSPSSSFVSWDQWLMTIALIVLCVVILGYFVYEAVMCTAAEMLRNLLMISPLVLIILVHWLSSTPNRFNIPLPGSDPDDIHRAGGSPWGITLVLAVLFFIISQ